MIRLHSFWTPQAALSKSVAPEGCRLVAA